MHTTEEGSVVPGGESGVFKYIHTYYAAPPPALPQERSTWTTAGEWKTDTESILLSLGLFFFLPALRPGGTRVQEKFRKLRT